MGVSSAARRGDLGTVSQQDLLPSTESLSLQRMIPESGFQGGVHGENMIAQPSSSYISSDPNEWSHSREMRIPPQKITINNDDGETAPL